MSQSSGNSTKVWLFSGVGVLLVAGVLILVNYLASMMNMKADFTEYKLYTLTQGTRNILERLDTPVEIRYFATSDKSAMPTSWLEYSERVKSLLLEYQEAAPEGKIKLEFFDPEPDSEAETTAAMNGVRPQMTNVGVQVFLGLSVTMLDKTEALPVLDPSQDQMLEYDLSRSIVSVSTNKKPVVGLMTGLPMDGGPQMPPQMRQQQPQQQPWFIYNQLKQSFDVRDLSLTAQEKIDDDIDLLVVVHPSGITDEVEFAIDQFLLRGGRILAFLDPYSYFTAMSQQQQQQQNPGMPTTGQTSDLAKLLPAWGIEFETNAVVADATYRTQLSQTDYSPAVLTLTNKAINPDDVVTSQIRDMFLVFAGAFYGDPKEGLTKEVLVHSSDQAMTIDPQKVQFGGPPVTVEPTGKEYALALRLSGKFKTAFPEGKPSTETADPTDPANPAEGDPAEDEPKKEEEAKPVDDSLKESQKEGTVILVADSDLLYDAFSVEFIQMIRQYTYRNSNLPFVQNTVDHLAGDSDLIAVRSRGSAQRPFTTFRKMIEEAESKKAAAIADATEKAQEAETKFNELQQAKDADQRLIMSPEQKAESEKFRKALAEAKAKERDLRKELRKEVTSKESRIKVLNTFVVPLLVVLAGLVHFFVRRSATSAK